MSIFVTKLELFYYVLLPLIITLNVKSRGGIEIMERDTRIAFGRFDSSCYDSRHLFYF